MKKIGLKRLGIIAVFAFSIALTSCGGSSGGGESEINFDKTKLVGKYWFANDFVSDNYSQDDDLIVYWFARNGDLVKQEYGGREESPVGTWSLDEKKLVIKDKTFGNGESIDWFLQKGTNSDNLVLSANNRRKLNCSTSFSVLNDVKADAFVVSYINLAGDVSRYMQCRVIGRDIKEAKLLFKDGKKLGLVKSVEGTESVYVLSDSDINSLKSVSFPEEDDVKFHLVFDNNVDVKLADVNDDKTIASLKNVVGYNQGTHSVNWKSIDENDIFYNIEIVDLEGKILFRTNPISAKANEDMEILINKDLKEEFGSLGAIEIGKQYNIRITGIKYEDDVASTSKHILDNVQAKTVLAYTIIW